MFPYTHAPADATVQRILANENAHLRAQVHSLKGRVSHLEAENERLRSMVTGTAVPPPPGHIYSTLNDNIAHLPMAIESLAVMQDHFRRQGTLKQCSTTGCHRDAFEQACFREGHMAWCRTHNRIITRTYTSCSVKAEERGDCMPVYWEDCHNWQNIVARASRDGTVGRKGLENGFLNYRLFPPVHASRPATMPQGLYP